MPRSTFGALLNAVVPDDLDAVSPRVTKVEERSRQHSTPASASAELGGVLVVNNKTEVAPAIQRLIASL
jgi:hypothetical protein